MSGIIIESGYKLSDCLFCSLFCIYALAGIDEAAYVLTESISEVIVV